MSKLKGNVEMKVASNFLNFILKQFGFINHVKEYNQHKNIHLEDEISGFIHHFKEYHYPDHVK